MSRLGIPLVLQLARLRKGIEETMAKEDTALNQDLNSGTSSFSPAHKHLQDDSPETVVSPKDEQAAIDRIGMESAKRAEHRIQKNEERIPSSTLFTK
jgi:hypothetical protein